MEENHKRRYILFSAQILCFIFAAVLLARPCYRYGRRLYRGFQDRGIWEEWKKAPSAPAAPVDPGAWLTFPAAGIDTLVRRGGSSENLLLGPCMLETSGHLRVISAHRDLDFRGLEMVSVGDSS